MCIPPNYLDEGLRTQLGDDDAIDVPQEATLNQIGLAIADVTVGWPFAKITFGIHQVCSRYEGLLKLLYAVYDQEYWYRCLSSEALAVMDMEDNVARANRGPWGLVKILRSTEESVKEAVKFMFKHLFIWVPVQVAVNVIQAHLRGQEVSRACGTKIPIGKV